MVGNYLHLCGRSQDRKGDQVHPKLLQMATVKTVHGLFREQIYLCSRLNFLESLVPGCGTVTFLISEFSVSGSFQSALADCCFCELGKVFLNLMRGRILWPCQSLAL